ncbi:hypothetical protein PanWU01x14_054330 [Parasponia andersonii]|uniref:Uncharacterized protein n=1 Tax=Parasponia andersonii TaxID=3476 RepID=A0A2P5DKR9_PARAD|nr:hypothetical protein PanWU01x14_054330 [Parasponia andersonii]
MDRSAYEEKHMFIIGIKSNWTPAHVLCVAAFHSKVMNQKPTRSGCVVEIPASENVGIHPLIPIQLKQPKSPPNHPNACPLAHSPPIQAEFSGQANETATLRITDLLVQIKGRNSSKRVVTKRPVYKPVAASDGCRVPIEQALLRELEN